MTGRLIVWRRVVGASLSVGVTLLAGGIAHADGKDCNGYPSLKDSPTLGVAKVTSDDKRINFIKGETDDKACPAETSACRRKGFVVPGNAIIVSGYAGAFACATYVNAKGLETNGWLPKAALTIDPANAKPSTEDWVGTWVREEASVKIKPDSKRGLSIKGEATFGAGDPERRKNGAVNMGDIAGAVSPTGDTLSFAMGDADKTLPVDKGDDSTCKVWMRRLGPFLLVDDNNACGGMNVSFRGTYSRK